MYLNNALLFFSTFFLMDIIIYFIFFPADLSDIVDICCEKGTDWAKSDTRCDNYPSAVLDVDSYAEDQRLCRTVLEVCCLKSKQEQMCAQGKLDAKDYSTCAIREDILGAVTYRVSCNFYHIYLTILGKRFFFLQKYYSISCEILRQKEFFLSQKKKKKIHKV